MTIIYAVLIGVPLASLAWIVWEAYIAPLVDEDER